MKETRKKNNPQKIGDFVKHTRIGRASEEYEAFIRDNKKWIVLYTIAAFFLSAFLSGAFIRKVTSLGGRHPKAWGNAILSPFGIFILLALFALSMLIGVRAWRILRINYTWDEENQRMISDTHEYGNAHFQTLEERKVTCEMSKDLDSISKPILGQDELGNYCALKEGHHGLNWNKIYVGSPGSGKTDGLIIPEIYQAIKRGDSLVVTDSKGEAYMRTAMLAKKHGYTVRVFNLKRKELKNSDGCNFFQSLDKDSDADATSLATTIIENTDGPTLDYWATNELNLIKACICYVASSEEHIRLGTNTLAEAYRMMVTNDPDRLQMIFAPLDDDEPAKMAFNIFNTCDPKVKAQILNGACIKMQLIGNKYVKKMVSEDEIDFTLPYRKKCIYYVIIDDIDTSFKYIASLFFSSMLKSQCDYADSQTKEEKADRIPIYYLLDEFANTGAIANFQNVITTVRSRSIGIIVVLQDIGQLKNLYPDEVWTTILNAMSIKVLLKTNDTNTAQYFSELMGITTLKMENTRYANTLTDVAKIHNAHAISEGLGQVELMQASQLINDLDSSHQIVLVSSFQPMKLKKVFAAEYSMDAEVEEVLACNHVPRWRKRMMKEQAEQKLKEEGRRKEREMAKGEKADAAGGKQEGKKKAAETACQTCGCILDGEYAFCPECGTKMVKDAKNNRNPEKNNGKSVKNTKTGGGPVLTEEPEPAKMQPTASGAKKRKPTCWNCKKEMDKRYEVCPYCRTKLTDGFDL